MIADDNRKRYHVVKHTFTVVHEYPVKYEESAEFALTENHCCHNVVNDLHGAVEAESEFSICSTCAHETAEYVGGFDTLEEAEEVGGYDMNADRIRARLSGGGEP